MQILLKAEIKFIYDINYRWRNCTRKFIIKLLQRSNKQYFYQQIMGQDQLKIGQKFKDRYLILQSLYPNQLCRAYIAQDHFNQKNKIVIKIINIIPNMRQSAISLISKQISLRHPNICEIYDYQFGEITQNQLPLYIIMQFIDGSQLKSLYNKLTKEQTLKIYNQMKQGIQHLHANKILHKNINLKNIILDKQGNVKLRNFMIQGRIYVHQNEVLYKDHFYDPPQFRDLQMIRYELDLWLLGLLMIELLTGKQIYQLVQEKDQNGNFIYPHPATNLSFPKLIFQKYYITKDFQQIISNLLTKDYKVRKFYEDVTLEDITIKTGLLNKQQCLQLQLKQLNDYQLLQQIMPYYDHIRQLNCSNNFLTDQSGIAIINCSKLLKLNISGNNLTDKFIINIQKILIRLVKLNIAFTNITDDSIFLITKHSKYLQSLDISYTRTSSEGIKCLSQLNKLSQLAIWNGIDYYLSKYQKHVQIHVCVNYDKYWYNTIIINKKCLRELQKLRLKALTLDLQEHDANRIIENLDPNTSCIEIIGKIKPSNIQKIVQLKQLQYIYLQEVRIHVIKQFNSKILRSVTLAACDIKVQTLLECLSKCESLQYLDLSYNQIGNEAVKQIAMKLKKLTTLILSSNRISNEGVTYIARNIKNLNILNLSNNCIGNEGTIEITRNLKQITVLDLSSNKIDNQGAVIISHNLKKILVLNLMCNDIDQETKILVKQVLKNTKISI